MYFPIISSSVEEDECKQILKMKLEAIKEDVDNLVHWNNQHVDECSRGYFEAKENYNNNYLELQKLINKILK